MGSIITTNWCQWDWSLWGKLGVHTQISIPPGWAFAQLQTVDLPETNCYSVFCSTAVTNKNVLKHWLTGRKETLKYKREIKVQMTML